MSVQNGPEILLVGCGKMGQAMLAGWLEGGAIGHATVVEPGGLPTALADDARVRLLEDPPEIPAEYRADLVVLAVKPQIMPVAAPTYRAIVARGAAVLSIAAGKTLAGFAGWYGDDAAVVRAMPNTPAAIGRGISVAIANRNVTPAQRALCDRLLAAVGSVEWVADEGLLDIVTALSGGGPAYVFLLIEALAVAGAKAGLPEALAMRLARETVSGSGELARLSPDSSAAQLRQNVTSPKGTTLAALEVLMAADGIQPIFDAAIAAATARSRELAQ
jgi:pyrroline-5-carboxylate reductase